MSERRLRLLPRRKITVWVHSGDGERFVDLFRSCWKQLPQAVQRRISMHWKSTRDQYCPRIELSDIWGESQTCYGQVRNHGMEMRFSASKFDERPYHAARWVIAHELAHVYQKAIGRQPGGMNEDENERDADGLAKKWGFPSESSTLIDMLIGKLGLEGACRRAGDIESILSLKCHDVPGMSTTERLDRAGAPDR